MQDHPEAEARFQCILKQYGDLLRNAIAAQFPKDIGLSFDDILQEAHLKLWRAISGGREITNLPSYLHRVAATVTVDAIRRSQARREEQILTQNNDMSDKEYRQPLDEQYSPETIACGQHLLGIVGKMIGCFAAERRYAVRLYLLGWNTREISVLTGWSKPKARNLVYRGLEELRNQLREQGYGTPRP